MPGPTFDSVAVGDDLPALLLPPLDSYENIRDFIACVTRGLVLDSFNFRDGKELLYAAQIAVSALRAQPRAAKSPGRPRKGETNEELDPPQSEAG